MQIVSYLILVTLSVIGIVFFDDNPRSVSLREWVLFAVLLYSAISLLRIIKGMYDDHH